MGHLGAAGTGLEQGHAQFMCADVRLPKLQARIVDRFHEKRSFKRSVITRNHRKGVERQDIATFQNAAGDRVMRAIRIDPRLEPDPGVAVFCIRKAFSDLELHRIPASHGHVNFARTHLDRVADGVTADIGDLRAMPDQGNLGR